MSEIRDETSPAPFWKKKGYVQKWECEKCEAEFESDRLFNVKCPKCGSEQVVIFKERARVEVKTYTRERSSFQVGEAVKILVGGVFVVILFFFLAYTVPAAFQASGSQVTLTQAPPMPVVTATITTSSTATINGTNIASNSALPFFYSTFSVFFILVAGLMFFWVFFWVVMKDGFSRY